MVGGGKFDWSLGCYIDGNQCAVMVSCVKDNGVDRHWKQKLKSRQGRKKTSALIPW